MSHTISSIQARKERVNLKTGKWKPQKPKLDEKKQNRISKNHRKF